MVVADKPDLITPPDGPPASPGLLPVHYSPRTPLVLIVGEPVAARSRLRAEIGAALGAGQSVGVLALEDDAESFPPGAVLETVGMWANPSASACCCLFRFLSLAVLSLVIVCRAIMPRLLHSSPSSQVAGH